jgi:hypothetical protein
LAPQPHLPAGPSPNPRTPRPQLRDLSHELGLTRAAVARAEEEVARLKGLHAQVKGALEGAYSENQEHAKQVGGRRGLEK